MTSDDDDELVSARFVMKRTDVDNHVDAGTGIYPLSKMSSETAGLIDELRNRIPFRLEKKIRRGKKLIEQEDLAQETLKAFEQKGGAPILDENDRVFNPASDKEYTFNAALTIWDKRERAKDAN